jgi:SET domain-containing protein
MLERNDYKLSSGAHEEEEGLGGMCNCKLPAMAAPAPAGGAAGATAAAPVVGVEAVAVPLACIDDSCLNRQLKVECSSSCHMKSRCGNQCFALRRYAAVEVRPTGAKGHGLFCTSPLHRGQFVIEYVGEVVCGSEKERRIALYANSPHFYLMALRGDDSIDATRRGNMSRFINHSCAPNCETQKWEVAGKPCVGLFALTDIPAGTELTFDYKSARQTDRQTHHVEA